MNKSWFIIFEITMELHWNLTNRGLRPTGFLAFELPRDDIHQFRKLLKNKCSFNLDFVQNRSDPPSSPPDFWIRRKFWDTFPKVKIFGPFATLLGILIYPISRQKSVLKLLNLVKPPTLSTKNSKKLYHKKCPKRDTRFYPLFVQGWFVGNAKQINAVFFSNRWCLVIGSSQSPALFGLCSHCWYVYSLSKQLVEERSSSFFVFMNNLEISKSETSSQS